MSRGRQAHEWGIAATQMWLLAAINTDPNKARHITPDTFNPFSSKRGRKKRPPVEQVGVGILKAIFIDRTDPTPEQLKPDAHG